MVVADRTQHLTEASWTRRKGPIGYSRELGRLPSLRPHGDGVGCAVLCGD
jgi:hypothetical protein